MAHFRTIWLSDLHLGTRGCNAVRILCFLNNNTADKIYLVGDIIDGWALKNRMYWPQTHIDLVEKILSLVKSGVVVIYIPGNHDDFLRGYVDAEFGGVLIMKEACHTTVDGREFLVVHGDEFDLIILNYRWLAIFGDKLYTIMLALNNIYSWFLNKSGKPHFSLSQYLKHKVKDATNFIGDYEKSIAYECRSRGFAGIICGHIHYPDITNRDGITYLNIGDGVESCTALVEYYDGTIQLICYYDELNQPLKQLRGNIILDLKPVTEILDALAS
jgi:UDP-2,3-diacylglucosamine pyrophosphatase LpxH